MSVIYMKFLQDVRLGDRMKYASVTEDPKGWIFPLATQRMARAYPGLLLVGDAGAFASPLTGGGIYNTLKTAIIAVQVSYDVINSNLDTYQAINVYEKKWREVLASPF